MKYIIRLEEFAMMAGSIAVLAFYDAAWWWYLLLAVGPDISMLGYLAGNKAGAALYNFIHHKGIAVATIVTGYTLVRPELLMTGVVLFGHASMDRMFGYGLKLEDGFSFTHLGRIGKHN